MSLNFKLSMAFTNQQLDVIAQANTKVILAKPTLGL